MGCRNGRTASRDDRTEVHFELECLLRAANMAYRFCCLGRILKDGDLISSQGVKDGHIMHLVKSAAAASGTTPATAATASSQGNAPAPERTPQAAPSVGM